jgi:hypothetical protein
MDRREYGFLRASCSVLVHAGLKYEEHRVNDGIGPEAEVQKTLKRSFTDFKPAFMIHEKNEAAVFGIDHCVISPGGGRCLASCRQRMPHRT